MIFASGCRPNECRTVAISPPEQAAAGVGVGGAGAVGIQGGAEAVFVVVGVGLPRERRARTAEKRGGVEGGAVGGVLDAQRLCALAGDAVGRSGGGA